MEMTGSPVRRMFSAPWDSEGYHTCYPLDGAGAEPDFPAGRSHTAPNPELDHDGERCREGRQQQESQGIPRSVCWERRQEEGTVTGRATP